MQGAHLSTATWCGSCDGAVGGQQLSTVTSSSDMPFVLQGAADSQTGCCLRLLASSSNNPIAVQVLLCIGCYGSHTQNILLIMQRVHSPKFSEHCASIIARHYAADSVL
jgi:hypothetical protein